MNLPQTNCRNFSGYKPCHLSESCSKDCKHLSIPSVYLLVVHLGALGAVARATSILRSMKLKYPNSHITWVTDKPADQVLKQNSKIDRVLTTSESDLLSLQALEFDIAFVIDKSLKASGILKRTQVDQIYGFVADGRSGAILPATAAADELWQTGLSNHIKFNVNQKTEVQLIHESLELPYLNSDYDMPFSKTELSQVQRKKHLWSLGQTQKVIGLNTGCADTIPAKKLSYEQHVGLIKNLLLEELYSVVLLGGPEDTARNDRIYREICSEMSPNLTKNLWNSASNQGIRDGYTSIAACDLVVTGDSFGMHLAIAAKVYVVAWFGPTCAHEIEFYGRGVAIKSPAPCSPCWKRSCDKEQMCYDLVDLKDLQSAINKGLKEARSTIGVVDKIDSSEI
jgi:heptosyltransferase II